MTRIAIIGASGDHQIDRVLKGVMGHLSPEGVFAPIEEFKNIPLISGMTTEMMQKIVTKEDGTEGLIVVDIDDANLPAFKAIMASKLLQSWETAYRAVLSQTNAGLARAAVAGELAKVREGCEACTQVFAGDAPWVRVAKSFDDVPGEEGEEGEGFLNASTVLLNNPENWVPYVGEVATGPFPFDDANRSFEGDLQNASGVAVLQLRYNGTPDGLASILNQLPADVASMLCVSDESEGGRQTMTTGFAEISWHAPRPANVDTASQADAGANAEHNETTSLQAVPVAAGLNTGSQIGASLGVADPIAEAYQRGLMTGRIEGYSDGYIAKTNETPDEDEAPEADAPTAG